MDTLRPLTWPERHHLRESMGKLVRYRIIDLMQLPQTGDPLKEYYHFNDDVSLEETSTSYLELVDLVTNGKKEASFQRQLLKYIEVSQDGARFSDDTDPHGMVVVKVISKDPLDEESPVSLTIISLCNGCIYVEGSLYDSYLPESSNNYGKVYTAVEQLTQLTQGVNPVSTALVA